MANYSYQVDKKENNKFSTQR